jgi:hypothetical protein
MPQQWDFFLAHAGADAQAAEDLYQHLVRHARVVLDSHSLLSGDDWSRELPRAQRGSLISVVLISRVAEHAYSEKEEIATAIQVARQDPQRHRVVPAFLARPTASRDEIPAACACGTAFLTTLWESGALLGNCVEEAFFVHCDERTMTQDGIDNRRLICVIGVSLVEPRIGETLTITVQAQAPKTAAC